MNRNFYRLLLAITGIIVLALNWWFGPPSYPVDNLLLNFVGLTFLYSAWTLK